MKSINYKMYLSKALGKLPSDPSLLAKGQPPNTEIAVGSGSHCY